MTKVVCRLRITLALTLLILIVSIPLAGKAKCGDGQPIEDRLQCEGGYLGYQSCATVGYGGGTLKCDSTCGFDYSGCIPINAVDCSSSPNGDPSVRGYVEGKNKDGSSYRFYNECGPMNDFIKWQCNYSRNGNPLPIAVRWSCDGPCKEGICLPRQECGNNKIEEGEDCDGVNLNNSSCVSLGYAGGGTLKCDKNCKFNYSACIKSSTCGNNIIESGEECDGSALNNATCITQGLTGGAIKCGPTCKFDLGDCKTTTNCVDSDNGANVYKKGSVTIYNYDGSIREVLIDTCRDANYVYEQVCLNGGKSLKEGHVCPTDYTCENGACVHVPVSIIINCPDNFIYSNGSCQPKVDIVPVTSSTKQYIEEEKNLTTIIDRQLTQKLIGRILLQVESHGEAWYVNPRDSKRYYMADGNAAYLIMRRLGMGISNIDLARINSDNSIALKHAGKIFLQVQAHGEAYYIDFEGTLRYLKDGSAAYTLMRTLGQGISNTDIRKIAIGELEP